MPQSRSIIAVYDIACEACDSPFRYEKRVTVLGSGSTTVISERLQAKASAGGGAGFKRCPKCGFIQSWMTEGYREWFGYVGLLSGLGPLVAVYLFEQDLERLLGDSGRVLLLGVALFFLSVAGLLGGRRLTPNDQGHLRGKLPPPRRPAISYREPLI